MPFSKSLHLPISDTVVPIESLLTNIAVSACWLSSIVATTPSIPISACYSLELDSANNVLSRCSNFTNQSSIGCRTLCNINDFVL